MTTESHGSIQVIRQVTDIHRTFDVLVTADDHFIQPMMEATKTLAPGSPMRTGCPFDQHGPGLCPSEAELTRTGHPQQLLLQLSQPPGELGPSTNTTLSPHRYGGSDGPANWQMPDANTVPELGAHTLTSHPPMHQQGTSKHSQVCELGAADSPGSAGCGNGSHNMMAPAGGLAT